MALTAIQGPSVEDLIIADWRTGAFTIRQLADKHKVSKSKVGNVCKDVEKDLDKLVDTGIQYRQGLAAINGQAVHAVQEVVDSKMRHIEFFNRAAIKNVSEAMEQPCESQQDYRHRAETINKARETVLGKTPDTAVQINNGSDMPRTIVINGVDPVS